MIFGVREPGLADERKGPSVILTGEILNREELLASLGVPYAERPAVTDAKLLEKLYAASGLTRLAELNGRFAFAISDPVRGEVILGRDHLGVEPLYYSVANKAIVFASTLRAVIRHPAIEQTLNTDALQRYLVFGYNPSRDTFFRGVRKVDAGSTVVFGTSRCEERRFWRPEPRIDSRSLTEHCEALLDLMRDSVARRLAPADHLGLFLSGGMDSSSVAGLARECAAGPFHTYSYRCRGGSFDESGYARTMAAFCGSHHREVVFGPADLLSMPAVVEHMDEPFCNAGITVATHLLGRAAQGEVTTVLSGDGGDELFGGHPVYTADRVAERFDHVPSILSRPLVAALRRLPDSDQKLNLTVKLKRFSESMAYPRELGTFRWRIYYTGQELRAVLPQHEPAPDTALFGDLLDLGGEVDGPDPLSRSLYVDLFTEVGFYLRRMDLLRQFGITARFPLLDHRLVELAAGIPSNLKIRGAWDTKYIERQTMRGVLPETILNRKDKLGHSIPLKNWLRTEPAIRTFVQEVLGSRQLREIGVNSQHTRQLWEDHQAHRRNNSHRLWTLTVLGLWLAALDSNSTPGNDDETAASASHRSQRFS